MLMTVRMRRSDTRRLHAAQLRRELRTHLGKAHLAAQEMNGKDIVIVIEDARLRHE